MKKIILLSFLLTSLWMMQTQAQEKKLNYSAYTTWDYSNIPKSNLIDHRGKLAIGLGVQGNYQFNKRFEFIIGAAYIDKGYNQKTTSPGSDDGPVTQINHWWYAYFSVPVKIQYNIKNGDWKWYVSGGIENDFNFDGNGHYTFRKYAQSFVLNAGTSVLINQKMRLGIEPTYRNSIGVYATQNGGNNTRPDLNPYSFGLKILLTKVR